MSRITLVSAFMVGILVIISFLSIAIYKTDQVSQEAISADRASAELLWTAQEMQVDISQFDNTLLKYRLGLVDKNKVSLNYQLLLGRAYVVMEQLNKNKLDGQQEFRDRLQQIIDDIAQNEQQLVSSDLEDAEWFTSYTASQNSALKGIRKVVSDINHQKQINSSALWRHATTITSFFAYASTALILLLVISVIWLFNTANQARHEHQLAVDANKAKDTFLTTVTHELRTPLNGVMGMLALLQNESLTGKQKQQVDTAVSSGRTLLTLINDILDFSKSSANKLSLRPVAFNIADTFSFAYQSAKILADAKGIKLIFDTDDLGTQQLIGDPDRLTQILLNLLSNAIKFTEQGAVTVRAKMVEQDSNTQLVCQVEDTGTGIEASQLNNIFEQFIQTSEGAARQYGGTGLGLSIVRDLCRLMDGDVNASSVLGQGSTFTFTAIFEYCPSQPEQTETATINEHNVTLPLVHDETPSPQFVTEPDPMILIVDDNETNRIVASGWLESIGLRNICVESGSEALATLNNAASYNPFHLILMDCQMPQMDGYETSRRIRAGEAGEDYCQIPIVALTAVPANDVERKKCVDNGMNEIISKPIDFSAGKNTLKQFLMIS